MRARPSTVFCGSVTKNGMTIETTANVTSDATGLTPVMREDFAAKEAHPDCLMFCRIGDFYESSNSATRIVASRELQLTLTACDKEKKQPMCGVPYHAGGAVYSSDCCARAIVLPCASRWKTRS